MDIVDKSLGDDLALPGSEVDGLSSVLDRTVVIGQQVGQLSQIDLGGRLAGQVVEAAPPALELLLVRLGTVLRDRCSGSG